MRTIVLSAGLWLGSASVAHAFCGFYVASADAEPKNNATMVVLMRDGTKTVLSMQNDYEGPAEDFAMVVPVPIVLREENVRTLPRDVFDRVNVIAAPRLVEYWEQDPCNQESFGLGGLGLRGTGRGGGGIGMGTIGLGSLVTVEAEFAVGEYDIVILGARDSSALEVWLREHGYRIPEGAAELLRPYIEDGMKFFVAKVDVDRVTFENGRAVLSPLRVWYDDETFRLPVRLGLLSSAGTQDLVVHVLALGQRYEVANYPNVTMPTNLDVTNAARDRFAELYAALFDRTVAESRGAVVTEYAWQASSCDPCPGPPLASNDIATLGGDVLFPRPSGRVRLGAVSVGEGLPRDAARRVLARHANELEHCYHHALAADATVRGQVQLSLTVSPSGAVQDAEAAGEAPPRLLQCLRMAGRRWTFPAPDGRRSTDVMVPVALSPRPTTAAEARGAVVDPSAFDRMVLTRLHHRYTEEGLDEDLVFRAAEPISGGREVVDESGAVEKGSQPAPENNFQARYVIRHPWQGAIGCDNPVRGVWGGPPSGSSERPGTRTATDTALVPRGDIDLDAMLKDGLAAIGSEADAPIVPPALPPTPPAAAVAADEGCGACSASSAADAAAAVIPLLLALGLVAGRRR